MIPFGYCVLLWRLKRGLSQEVLARKAGLARPNLSDVERGEREVSLRTLRALALALDITPGVLADGIGPDQAGGKALSREKLERVAQSVAGGKELTDPLEKDLAGKITPLVTSLLRAQGFRAASRSRKGLAAQRAWLSLKSAYSSPEIQSLVERISEKAGHFSTGHAGEKQAVHVTARKK